MPTGFDAKSERLICRRKKRLSRLRIAFATVVVVMLAPAWGDPISPRTIAQQAGKAVVGIAAINQWGEEESTGSGFFVDGKGTFVTNFHVVEGAYSLAVELSSGERFSQVYVLGIMPDRDLALLRIDAKNTTPVTLGDDAEAEIGDTVYVMGNPLGMDRTFSNGLVSARRLLEGTNYIQISAPISPGSSGGPVMDEVGDVIGVATATFEDGQNLNLAIPTSYVESLLLQKEPPKAFKGERVPVGNISELGRRGWFGPASIDTGTGDEWELLVREQLAGIEEVLREEQFERSHDVYLGELTPWGSSLAKVRFEGGRSYLLTAACDQDCADLDLFLYDRAEQLVMEDVEVTDSPMLEFQPRTSGEYLVRVRMADCGADVCIYGIAIFQDK